MTAHQRSLLNLVFRRWFVIAD
jgi:Mechanosensitive ion channel, beta-domain